MNRSINKKSIFDLHISSHHITSHHPIPSTERERGKVNDKRTTKEQKSNKAYETERITRVYQNDKNGKDNKEICIAKTKPFFVAVALLSTAAGDVDDSGNNDAKKHCGGVLFVLFDSFPPSLIDDVVDTNIVVVVLSEPIGCQGFRYRRRRTRTRIRKSPTSKRPWWVR
jgi:hypothetical protein